MDWLPIEIIERICIFMSINAIRNLINVFSVTISNKFWFNLIPYNLDYNPDIEYGKVYVQYVNSKIDIKYTLFYFNLLQGCDIQQQFKMTIILLTSPYFSKETIKSYLTPELIADMKDILRRLNYTISNNMLEILSENMQFDPSFHLHKTLMMDDADNLHKCRVAAGVNENQLRDITIEYDAIECLKLMRNPLSLRNWVKAIESNSYKIIDYIKYPIDSSMISDLVRLVGDRVSIYNRLTMTPECKEELLRRFDLGWYGKTLKLYQKINH